MDGGPRLCRVRSQEIRKPAAACAASSGWPDRPTMNVFVRSGPDKVVWRAGVKLSAHGQRGPICRISPCTVPG